MNTEEMYEEKEEQKVYDFWEQVEQFANATGQPVICIIPVEQVSKGKE